MQLTELIRAEVKLSVDRCSVGAFFAVLLCSVSLGAQQDSRNYDHFDIRLEPSVQTGRAFSASASTATVSFPRAEYDLGGPLTEASSGDLDLVARRFLENSSKGFGALRSFGLDVEIVSRYESRKADLTHIVFRPTYLGIPYFDADLSVHLDGEGRVWRLNRDTHPFPPSGLSTSVDARAAVERALATLGFEPEGGPTSVGEASGPDRRSVFRHPGLGRIPVSLVWFPAQPAALAAWRLYVEGPGRAYLVVVDAASGEVLFSRNLTSQSSPLGRVFRLPDRPHPDAGGQTDEALTGGPSSAGPCPADIYPARFQAGAQAGRCWVESDETRGNNADVCLDAAADNICDTHARDNAAHFLFNFTNDYDTANNAVSDRAAAIVNAFYWVNALHDRYYRLGFDEPSGNFQDDNYGCGGAAGDALRVDVQDGGATNNAFFTTPPDGIAPRMKMGLFTGLRRDTAFDGDILTHEYAHGLTNRLIGGPTNVTGLWRWHSGAMAEGWSDAFAVSLTGDPVMGEYSTRNPTTGFRSVAYDASPYTFGQFGTLFRKAIPGTTLALDLPQLHRDGEIWATVLWDLRTSLGEDDFEQTITTALKLTPTRPSMLDARDAVLQAAAALNVGGTNACNAWAVFAARGFGASAALNPKQIEQPNDTALSVYEAFDLPSVCGGEAALPVDPIFDDDAEDAAAGWTPTGMWHRTTRRAATGAYSWWFGDEATENYDTGARNSGSLTSPPIDPSDVTAAAVEWDQMFRGEGFGPSVDLGFGSGAPYLNSDAGRLMIRADGGSWKTLTHLAHNNSTDSFEHHKINLSRFAGSLIELQFDFDTIDASDNHFEGWFVDNVRVSRLSSTANELSVSPSQLSFSGVAGGAPPAARTLAIREASGGAMTWSASVSSDSPWLSLSSDSGAAPADISVAVNPAGLSAGSYAGTITVAAPDAVGSPATVDVTFVLGAPAGPIAAWSFEDAGSGPGVTIVDGSGSHHGTTNGFGTVRVPAVAGSGRLFNGSTDYVEVPASASLTPQSFTIRTWVKVLSFPEKFGMVVSAFGGGNHQGWYLAVKSSGEVIFMGASPPSSAPWLVSSAKLSLHQWHAVSVTVDRSSGDVAIYVDGQPDSAARFPAIEADPAAPLTVGRASWYDGYYLNFAVDETQIYPAPRTAAEINADYQFFGPPPPPPNLTTVAEWKFETGAPDDSGNGHTGSLNGTQTVAGVEGNGRGFNGSSDSVTVAAAADLTPVDFTLRGWVKLNSAPADWGVVASAYGGAFDGWYLAVDNGGRVSFTAAGLPSHLTTVTSQSAITPGAWHHVTVSYHGATRRLKLYLDGALDAEGYAQALTPHVNGVMAMGRASWTNGRYLAMDLDELRIDPVVWSSAAVQFDFASFAVNQPLDPAAIWAFDETAAGPGVVLADSSGNGHNATTQGPASASVGGVVNAARRFPGRPDYAWLAPAAALRTSSFSFATWVKIDSLPEKWGVIHADYGGDFQGWYVGVHTDGSVIFSVSGLPSSNPWLLSATALTPGQWHYVTVTLEGTSRRGRIYLDSTLDRTAVFPAFTHQTSVQPTFGKASWVDSYYLTCALDEARFYPGELTAEAVGALFAGFPTPNPPAPPTLISEWRFEETGTAAGTTLIDSATGHHAVTVGDGTAPSTGVIGSARRFGGFPDYAWISPHADFGTADFSFTSWVKIDALPSKWGVVFADYGGDFQGWYVGVHTDGRVIFSVSGLPSSNPWLLSSSALVPGEWQHLAVTFDGTTRRGLIYINGLLDRTAVFPAFDPQSAVASTFGRASWADTYYLDFAIDQARLYGEELSDAEVLAVMQGAL